MSGPQPRKRPWYMIEDQWLHIQGQQMADQLAAHTPPVRPDLWAKLTPMEQAQIMAQHAGQQALVRSQQQASRRLSITLIVIFVVIPATISILWYAATVLNR